MVPSERQNWTVRWKDITDNRLQLVLRRNELLRLLTGLIVLL